MRTELIHSLAEKLNKAREIGDKELFNKIVMNVRFSLLNNEEAKQLNELANDLKWSLK